MTDINLPPKAFITEDARAGLTAIRRSIDRAATTGDTEVLGEAVSRLDDLAETIELMCTLLEATERAAAYGELLITKDRERRVYWERLEAAIEAWKEGKLAYAKRVAEDRNRDRGGAGPPGASLGDDPGRGDNVHAAHRDDHLRDG